MADSVTPKRGVGGSNPLVGAKSAASRLDGLRRFLFPLKSLKFSELFVTSLDFGIERYDNCFIIYYIYLKEFF